MMTRSSLLAFAQLSGQLGAKDLVRAAIKLNRLPETVANDRAYLNAVDANLRSPDPR